MLGNFTYCNPTKLYFGEDSLDNLNNRTPEVRKQHRVDLWRRFCEEKWHL